MSSATANGNLIGAFKNTAEQTAEETAGPTAEAMGKAAKWLHTSNKFVIAAMAAATLIGAATVVNNVNNEKDSDNLTQQQKDTNNKSRKKQKKNDRRYKSLGYGYETQQEVLDNASHGQKFKGDPVLNMMQDDNVVQNMYSNRIGHTKMGNAKFS